MAAEPGSARNLADEMTWRVRLRIGVYRTDMLGVRFTKDEVRYPRYLRTSRPGVISRQANRKSREGRARHLIQE